MNKACVDLMAIPEKHSLPPRKPFLKWAGGKRQLLPQLLARVPTDYYCYYEPFVGAGALLFALQPARAVINDTNAELINCYGVIQEHLEALLTWLDTHKQSHNRDYYYQVREWDRRPRSYARMHPARRAGRLIYLNKTCYNGLYRVNSKGCFNVPCGRYKNPNILDQETLQSAADYLRSAALTLRRGDFAKAVKDAGEGDFVYLDPPYDPLSTTASFTSYAAAGFPREEQERLRETFDDLNRRGCKVLLSNAYTPFIEKLYKGYTLQRVDAHRYINSKAAGRGKIQEVLVMNYHI